MGKEKLRGLKGLKGIGDMSKEEYSAFVEKNRAKIAAHNYDPAYISNLYENKQFIDIYGIDAFRATPGLENRRKLLQDDLKEVNSVSQKKKNTQTHQVNVEPIKEGKIDLNAGTNTNVNAEDFNKDTVNKAKSGEIKFDTSANAYKDKDPIEANTKNQATALKGVVRDYAQYDKLYKESLAEYEEKYGVGRNSTNLNAIQHIEDVSKKYSSHYKRYVGTDKLPEGSYDKKELAAKYDAWKAAKGEDYANIMLDSFYKDIVGEHQGQFEQAMDAFTHLIPTIEGGAVETAGNVYGSVISPILKMINSEWGLEENKDLSAWDNYWDNAIDNSITRLGQDIEHSGASYIGQGIGNLLGYNDETASERIEATKNTATKYNPEGIGNDAIITTKAQDNSIINSATPWLALQSNGFTALSMLEGWGLAKAAGLTFKGVYRGMNLLNKAKWLFKTEESLVKWLGRAKSLQGGVNTYIIPGLVGGTEGLLEGLQTKKQVEQDNFQQLDDFYKSLVENEVNTLWEQEKDKPETFTEVRGRDGQKEMRKTGGKSRAQLYTEVWNKYKDEYMDSRRHIEIAAAKAGQYNFWANSLINGMINQTLKMGLQAGSVQESIKNSKVFGWAYKKPKFQVSGNTVTPKKFTKAGTVWKLLKEPLGEGLEEYLQSVSNDATSGAAESNIAEFIKARFDGDANVEVGQKFGTEWGAALNATLKSLTSAESAQSAVLGALGSVMGTIVKPGHIYHRNEEGKLEEHNAWNVKYWGKPAYNSKGEKMSKWDIAATATPWRSSVISAYRERKAEMDEAEESAKHLTEWLRDPKNKEKWDGVVGTAAWINKMKSAAESNDQFSYRKAELGKAVNDAITLSKLEGTDFYDALMKQLEISANLTKESEEGKAIIASMRQSDENAKDLTDDEIVSQVKENANKMLGIMEAVEKEDKSITRKLGRVNEDTKQSLIFGKLAKDHFKEMLDKYTTDVDNVKSNIENSRESDGAYLTETQKKLIAEYGSLSKAAKERTKYEEKKERAEETLADKNATKEAKDKAKKEKAEAEKNLKKFERMGSVSNEGKLLNPVTAEEEVLNEEEIMNLDPVTRAMMLAGGGAKYYNATHQNRERIDNLKLQISEIEDQIAAEEEKIKGWSDSNGRVKKGHNKQVKRSNKQIEKLNKEKEEKEKDLQIEKGETDTNPQYSEAQQTVIDNIINQGVESDPDFFDKIVDIGRYKASIDAYNHQMREIYSDPDTFAHYVRNFKYKAMIDLAKRRAEWVSGLESYEEFSKELDKLTANASEAEQFAIFNTLREKDRQKKKEMQAALEESREESKEEEENNEDSADTTQPVTLPKTNLDLYFENQQKQDQLINQMIKNKELTNNDMSLLLDAMQYISQKGVDVMNKEKAIELLLEAGDDSVFGSKFREWVEEKNSKMSPEQRAVMPIWTSIGQIVNQYKSILDGIDADLKNSNNITPTITIENPESISPAPTEEKKEGGKSLMEIGSTTPDGQQFTDDKGTVTTDATLQAEQKRKAEEATKETNQELENDEDISELEKAFRKVTSPELARALMIIDSILATATFSENGKSVDITDEERELVRKSLIKITESEESLYVMDDIIDALLEEANSLQRTQDNVEDENNKKFSHAATVLQILSRKLRFREERKRPVDTKEKRAVSPKSSEIHTANIAYIESKNPDAWAVKFTNDYAIEEYCREHVFSRDTPVYFITNSEWTSEVTAQMKRDGKTYDTLSDMPLVIAVEVEQPEHTDNTTAIQIGNKWYQPIGVMPGVHSKSVSGAERTFHIRKLASKEQGVHLVTEDGLPNSNPLTSRVKGNNYMDAFHPDASSNTRNKNNKNSNTDIISDIIKTLDYKTAERLAALSKEEVLSDPDYQKARAEFIKRLSWGSSYEGGEAILNDQILHTPDNLKNNEPGKSNNIDARPTIVNTKDMSETAARKSDKLLPEVVESGTADEVVAFNSITQRLFSNVIRPLFEYISTVDSSKGGDRSAHVITQEDLDNNPRALEEESARLTKLFRGFRADNSTETHGISGLSDYIYITPKSGWDIHVEAVQSQSTFGDLDSSVTKYQVVLKNVDSSYDVVPLGVITAKASQGVNQENIDEAKSVLRNLLKECTSGVLKGQAVWQKNKINILNLNSKDSAKSSKARKVLSDMVDDGIFELWGSSLVYSVKGLTIKAPISEDGKRIQYPSTTVTNTDNATRPLAINDTPIAEGAIKTGTGAVVEEGSGAKLNDPPKGSGGNNEEETPREREARLKVEKIIADSQLFTLSEDETYYYITDNTTGRTTKYLRVTTAISADESVSQWFPELSKLMESLGKSLSDEAIKIIVQLNRGNNQAGKNLKAEDLKERQELINKLYNTLNTVDGIDKKTAKDAVAKLRTAHKNEKYGAWGTPSTALGNTADTITRDFFANELKNSYPNISEKVLDFFIKQLRAFDASLKEQGITIYSRDIKVHGKVTVTREDGTTQEVPMTGTLDLLGYDKQGNFYIFDMKTKRQASSQKLESEKAKWSRQLSLYADLLEQSYDIHVDPKNLRIIPISVDYEAPRGVGPGLNSKGPKYSVTENGQLQTTNVLKETKDFIIAESTDFSMMGTELDNQYQPGYTSSNIAWDNLSSEDQEIASAIEAEVTGTAGDTLAPIKEVEVETPQKESRLEGINASSLLTREDGTQAGTEHTPPPVENHTSWDKLTPLQKNLLKTIGISNENSYNAALSNPMKKKMIENRLKCAK